MGRGELARRARDRAAAERGRSRARRRALRRRNGAGRCPYLPRAPAVCTVAAPPLFSSLQEICASGGPRGAPEGGEAERERLRRAAFRQAPLPFLRFLPVGRPADDDAGRFGERFKGVFEFERGVFGALDRQPDADAAGDVLLGQVVFAARAGEGGAAVDRAAQFGARPAAHPAAHPRLADGRAGVDPQHGADPVEVFAVDVFFARLDLAFAEPHRAAARNRGGTRRRQGPALFPFDLHRGAPGRFGGQQRSRNRRDHPDHDHSDRPTRRPGLGENAQHRRARQDSNLRPLPPEGSALSS